MTTLFSTDSANKAVTYGVQDFLYRFRKLQLLCKRLDIDGILIICGFDSQNNEEYDKLTSWLFTGYSGNLVESEIYLDTKFKELVFLVQRNGASCYLETELFDMIQKYLISIPNINIFCPTPQQMENTDDVELLKISQFYKMTRNLGSVGVALGAKDDGKLRNIEKWPLLQAYALDDVGCGFFGMNHTASDITSELHKLYEEYDKYLLSNLISTSEKQMEHHINSTFYIIDSTEIKRRPKITEQEINTIIKETFEFSIIKQPSVGVFPDLPPSRILFGKNTNRGFFEQPTNQTFAECSASNEKAPLHFTLEYVDPTTRMRVGRTYFTTLNQSYQIVMKENKDEDGRLLSYRAEKAENPHFADEKLLIGYYAVIIRTFHSLLEHFSNNIQDLNQGFLEKKFYDEFCTPEGLNLSLDQLIVQLKCYNAYGVETKTNLNEASPDFVNQNLCILRVQIKNIKSYANEESLGSILFCETFYIQPGAYFLLTKNIPYFKAWTIDPTSSESVEKVKDVIICEEFGKPTSSSYESVYFYTPANEVFQRANLEHEPHKIQFTLHEDGFKIKSEHWGTIPLLYKDLERVELLRKFNRPAAALYFKEKTLFSAIGSDRFYLFFSGYAASDIFLQLHTIFDGKKIPYKNVDDIPEEIMGSTKLYYSGLLLDKYFKINRIQGNQIIDSPTFIKFLEYQQALKINNHKDLNFKLFYKLTEVPESKEKEPSKKIDVFFVNGAYSAGKNRFAENLASHAKNLDLKIHLYRKEPKELPYLNNKIFVEGLLEFIAKNKLGAGDKVIAVLPSSLNTKLIVDNILRMPEFTDPCDIKAIITKININNFYHNAHKEISENFLTFCGAGYSQFIIIDNYGTTDNEVDTISAALRGMFPSCTLFRINGNIVQQSIARDILTSDSFNAKINKIERKRNIPFKTVEKKYVYIPFKVPLMKERIHKYLYNHIFQENNGYLFSEDQDQEKVVPVDKRGKVEDELALLKDRIKRVNLELSKEVPSIYCVQGLVRFEDSLEEVYKISVNSNYVYEQPLPGIKGTISKADVKGMERTMIKYDNFDSSDLGLLFYGENLDEAKLKDLLKNLIKPLKLKLKLKTREELTEEMIRELELEHRNWGLEDGVFFDGSRFRDAEGKSLSHHPKLEEIIAEYLAKENDTVGTVNRQIDKEWKTIEQIWE